MRAIFNANVDKAERFNTEITEKAQRISLYLCAFSVISVLNLCALSETVLENSLKIYISNRLLYAAFLYDRAVLTESIANPTHCFDPSEGRA